MIATVINLFDSRPCFGLISYEFSHVLIWLLNRFYAQSGAEHKPATVHDGTCALVLIDGWHRSFFFWSHVSVAFGLSKHRKTIPIEANWKWIGKP